MQSTVVEVTLTLKMCCIYNTYFFSILPYMRFMWVCKLLQLIYNQPGLIPLTEFLRAEQFMYDGIQNDC